MTDLLKYTKKIYKKIVYFERIINNCKNDYLSNPFYKGRRLTAIWFEDKKQQL